MYTASNHKCIKLAITNYKASNHKCNKASNQKCNKASNHKCIQLVITHV